MADMIIDMNVTHTTMLARILTLAPSDGSMYLPMNRSAALPTTKVSRSMTTTHTTTYVGITWMMYSGLKSPMLLLMLNSAIR